MKTKTIKNGVKYIPLLSHDAFAEWLKSEAENLREMVINGNIEEAESEISAHISEALPFMLRKLSCRISKRGDKITVKCKNYSVKSLMAEYDVLFSKLNPIITDISFVSVREFEKYEIKEIII